MIASYGILFYLTTSFYLDYSARVFEAVLPLIIATSLNDQDFLLREAFISVLLLFGLMLWYVSKAVCYKKNRGKKMHFIRKKILHVIPSFDIGGAEKVVLDYLRYSDKENVDVRAISLFDDPKNHYTEVINEEGLEVYFLGKKSGFDPSMYRKIDNIIQNFKPDVVHSHLGTLKYLINFNMFRTDIKFFHTIHNEPEKDAKGFDYLVNKLAFKWLNVTPIALTEKYATNANEYYRINTSRFLNNGIYLDDFKYVEKDSSLKKKLGIFEDAFVIGHVGRFSKQKNHEFIIDVFNAVFRMNPNSMLLLIGDGELKTEIEKKVFSLSLEKNVKFLGVRQDIPELMSIMDVFLFPSLYEGFPITLIEAQAAGLKCVVSDTIDDNVFLTNRTISLSLKYQEEHWADTILDENKFQNNDYSIKDYDIQHILEKLYTIYFK